MHCVFIKTLVGSDLISTYFIRFYFNFIHFIVLAKPSDKDTFGS